MGELTGVLGLGVSALVKEIIIISYHQVGCDCKNRLSISPIAPIMQSLSASTSLSPHFYSKEALSVFKSLGWNFNQTGETKDELIPCNL